MMVYGVYSVYDKAIGAYGRPMFLQSDGQCLRSFIDEVNNPESGMHKHPEDYSLFKLGSWDDESAIFVAEEAPRCLARAHELLKVRQVVGDVANTLRGVEDA